MQWLLEALWGKSEISYYSALFAISFDLLISINVMLNLLTQFTTVVYKTVVNVCLVVSVPMIISLIENPLLAAYD